MSSLIASAEPSDAPDRQLDRQVYGKVEEWVGTWLDALGEMREREGPGGTPAILSSGSPSLGASLLDDDLGEGDDSGWLEDVSPGSARGRNLTEADWAVQLKLATAVRGGLGRAQQVAPEVMGQIWSNMDQMVLDCEYKPYE